LTVMASASTGDFISDAAIGLVSITSAAPLAAQMLFLFWFLWAHLKAMSHIHNLLEEYRKQGIVPNAREHDSQIIDRASLTSEIVDGVQESAGDIEAAASANANKPPKKKRSPKEFETLHYECITAKTRDLTISAALFCGAAFRFARYVIPFAVLCGDAERYANFPDYAAFFCNGLVQVLLARDLLLRASACCPVQMETKLPQTWMEAIVLALATIILVVTDSSIGGNESIKPVLHATGIVFGLIVLLKSILGVNSAEQYVLQTDVRLQLGIFFVWGFVSLPICKFFVNNFLFFIIII